MADERRTDLVAVVTPATTDILAVRQSGDTRDKRETIAQILGLLVETNDLSAAVVWANIPDANVPESAVTQHEAALAVASSQLTGLQLTDNSDVTTAGITARFGLMADGAAYVGRLLVEADVSDLQSYLLAEVNDLGVAVTWANIPDANVPESAATQHAAAVLAASGLQLTDNSDVVTAANTDKFVLAANGTTGYVGRLLVEADVSDLQAYLTAEVNDLGAAVTWANIPQVNVPTHTGEVTGAQALVLDPSGISGQTLVTAVTADMVLLWDATDSLLKRADVSDFIEPEINDLGAAVVWANVPQANIPDPLLGADGTAAAPTYSFGTDGGMGWYKQGANQLSVAIAGDKKFTFDNGSLSGSVTSAPSLQNETASQTNPTNCPNKSDTDTGLGWVGVNDMAIIAGALDCMRVRNISAARAIGFYVTAPIVLQTGVAVDSAGIHAALVNLGLITA